MPDMYLTEIGDIVVSPQGDLALTQTDLRNVVQQAYIRCMTDIGDYALYPTMGANLSSLVGMSQSPATGQLGINLISAALNREGVFAAQQLNIKAIPVSAQSIKFDIFLTATQKLSIAQQLSGV